MPARSVAPRSADLRRAEYAMNAAYDRVSGYAYVDLDNSPIEQHVRDLLDAIVEYKQIRDSEVIHARP